MFEGFEKALEGVTFIEFLGWILVTLVGIVAFGYLMYIFSEIYYSVKRSKENDQEIYAITERVKKLEKGKKK